MLENTSPTIRAAFWMAGALASFMAMAISGRELAGELTTFQILFFRSFIGLIFVLFFLQQSGWGQLRSGRPGIQFVRNIFHYGGQYGWFYGIGFLPLAEVFAIEFTVPIWTVVIAALMLGEKITKRKLAAVLIGFVGVLVILRPGSIPMSTASFAVLGCAFCYAMAHSFTKLLTRTDSPLCIIFYMTVIQLPFGFLGAIGDWAWPSMVAWPWVVLVGLTALSAHYCMARAFMLADATIVVPMDFLRLPLVGLVGYLFYNESLDIWVAVGAVIVFFASYINVKGSPKAS